MVGGMETLQLLGIALGLASLSGLNLYLTVLVTGLAVRFEWIQLAPAYSGLAVLSDPIILGLAGAFFLLEFFADKIPWVDSLWDSVHTFIRPVGAALLAILVLGEAHPVFDVVVALLAGSVALTSHVGKSASRLVVNASPEPFSNWGLSLAEDGIVVAGLAALVWNPLVGLGLALVLTLGLVFFGSRILRRVRSRLYFIRKKLSAPAEDPPVAELSSAPSLALECLLHQIHPGEVRPLWHVPAFSDRLPGIPSDLRGELIALAGEPPSLYWCGRSWRGRRWFQMLLRPGLYELHPGFLYDRLKVTEATGEVRAWKVDRTRRLALQAALASLPAAHGAEKRTEKVPLAATQAESSAADDVAATPPSAHGDSDPGGESPPK
jgi:hypothetical protein